MSSRDRHSARHSAERSLSPEDGTKGTEKGRYPHSPERIPSKKRDEEDDERSDRSSYSEDEYEPRSSGKTLASVVTVVSSSAVESKQKKPVDLSKTRAGGAYIPPAKLKMMQEQMEDKNSEEYQRLSWEQLKKRIHGQVNRVNVENITSVVTTLLHENIVRGKGLLARSIIQAQAFSPTFSHVYAALIAIINTKFPHIGELILRRLIIQFKRAYKTNDKSVALTSTKFIAHLVNQEVAHELLALELLMILLESPTDDSVEIAVGFLRECGAKLTEVSPRGLNAIFDRLRSILNDGDVDKRIQYMIEVAFHVRKDKFAAHSAIIKELDLVEDGDKITHTISLDDAQNPENLLNVFRYDPEFSKNEEMYNDIKADILGEGDSSDESGEEDEDDEEEAAGAPQQQTIIDNTEENLVAFRRTVYLTIQSSLNYDEAIHKLFKMEIKPGMEVELAHMILDCCCQQRTYERFYGLMAERLCRLRKEYQVNFEQLFKDTYDTIHRFEITKMRNAACMFAHLLYTDAITWKVLGHIRLNETDTTSAGRVFIKHLFQELASFMNLDKLYDRIQDPTMQEAFDGLFPRDNPRDTRFAVNFFTAIGLGGLTVDLRDHLKNGPQQEVVTLPQVPEPTVKQEENVLNFPTPAATASSDEDSGNSSESSSSESSGERRRKRKKKSKKKEASPPKKRHHSSRKKIKKEKRSQSPRRKRARS